MGSTNELRSRRGAWNPGQAVPWEIPEREGRGGEGEGGDGLVAVGDVLALHVEAIDDVPEGRERLVDGLRLRHRLGGSQRGEESRDWTPFRIPQARHRQEPQTTQ